MFLFSLSSKYFPISIWISSLALECLEMKSKVRGGKKNSAVNFYITLWHRGSTNSTKKKVKDGIPRLNTVSCTVTKFYI